MSLNPLTPVPAHLISVGKALSRSIYSATGDLLLSQGFVIESAEQMEALLNSGYFRNTKDDGGRTAAEPNTPASKSAEQGTATETNDAQVERVVMDEIRWQVGETFFLHQQGASVRYTARFIGYIKNRTVLVTMPIVDDKYVLIRDGQMFVVRAFSGKKAYAF